MIIIGKKPSRELRSIESTNITVTGWVEDIQKYLLEISVFVAPIRIGSGTRIKILEAMSYGIPVVSTKLGCMGLNVTNQKNILIAESSSEFAEKTIHLISNKKEREKIGAAGKKMVEKNYTWEVIFDRVRRIYQNENKFNHNS